MTRPVSFYKRDLEYWALVAEPVAVQSSNLKEVAYDMAEERMWVKFHSGSTYMYEGVKFQDYFDLMRARSHGRHFNAEVAYAFPYTRITSAMRGRPPAKPKLPKTSADEPAPA